MPTVDAALSEFLTSGLSLGVASRDDRLVPDVVRPAGIRVEPGGEEVSIFLAAAIGGQLLKNLESNRRIAVVASNVQDNRSVQIKGQVVEVRPARDDERPLMDQYRARYSRMLEPLGVPRSFALRTQIWPAVAITFRVEALFLQTPGPSAGQTFQAPLRSPGAAKG
ncbi:MAG TPA: hypothetical protein VLQ79_09905 [Myxococcaceae bacterium]|nr:hypothetical protein [Myxococcaceae bacterium]